MGKRDDIAKQIAALQQQLESADTDDVELWVEKDGARTRLTGGHAQKWLSRLGLGDDDQGDTAGDADAGDGGDSDTAGDPGPPSGHKYFRK